MNTTQEHLPISDIKEGIVLLKDGSGALILQVSAVNFGLLSQREQMGIIEAFAQTLNSLSFSIQIIIHSERLDISSYLALLDQAQRTQTNRLLAEMMAYYKMFIQSTIKENEVLDKKFYIVIPLFKLELGLVSSNEVLHQKIKTVLLPRRDQLIRQLSRIGLKTTQLTDLKLIELFYNIYNYNLKTVEVIKPEPVSLNQPKTPQPTNQPAQTAPPPPPKVATQPPVQPAQTSKAHPFIVEELEA